jgi:hypothetical protein
MGLMLMVISLGEDRCLGKGATASCFAIVAAAGKGCVTVPTGNIFPGPCPIRLNKLPRLAQWISR